MRTHYQSIDQYISNFPISTQTLLQELRLIIHESAPAASEKISYQMPTFYQNGNLVHFAAYERHLGFYPGARAIQVFAGEITKYKTSKGTIQFPIDQPLPRELIKKIVEFRVAENSTKPKKK
jgi:uncharacterized protein YdhG (YjbR/CyaY superfamily)